MPATSHKRLSLVGSALRDDFYPDSDVDVLVEFLPGHVPGFEFVTIERELSSLLQGRRVDLARELPYFISELHHRSFQHGQSLRCGYALVCLVVCHRRVRYDSNQSYSGDHGRASFHTSSPIVTFHRPGGRC